MPKGLYGFQKGHKGFGTKESYERAGKKNSIAKMGEKNPMYGKPAWNKGKKLPPRSKEIRIRIGEKLIGNTNGFKKGQACIVPLKSRKRGKDHHAWKGGISGKYEKIRHSLKYRNWRKEVYQNDYWTCQICQYKGIKIIAHHLLPFSKFPKLRFDISNGITMCRKCHFNFHKWYRKNIYIYEETIEDAKKVIKEYKQLEINQ